MMIQVIVRNLNVPNGMLIKVKTKVFKLNDKKIQILFFLIKKSFFIKIQQVIFQTGSYFRS